MKIRAALTFLLILCLPVISKAQSEDESLAKIRNKQTQAESVEDQEESYEKARRVVVIDMMSQLEDIIGQLEKRDSIHFLPIDSDSFCMQQGKINLATEKNNVIWGNCPMSVEALFVQPSGLDEIRFEIESCGPTSLGCDDKDDCCGSITFSTNYGNRILFRSSDVQEAARQHLVKKQAKAIRKAFIAELDADTK